MSFVNKSMACPDCPTEGRLNFVAAMEFGASESSDETAFQLLECERCALKIAAVYEESRRGRLDTETFSHKGYRVATGEWLAFRTFIFQCPSPKNKACLCPAHANLRRELSALREKQAFPIQFKTTTA